MESPLKYFKCSCGIEYTPTSHMWMPLFRTDKSVLMMSCERCGQVYERDMPPIIKIKDNE